MLVKCRLDVAQCLPNARGECLSIKMASSEGVCILQSFRVVITDKGRNQNDNSLINRKRARKLTPSITHSLNHYLSHSIQFLIHLFTFSLTYSLTSHHPPTPSPSTYSLTHSLTHLHLHTLSRCIVTKCF